MSETGKKITKFFIWFFAVAAILVIAVVAFAWFKAPQYIKKNLSEFVAEKSNGLYHATVRDAHLKIIPLSVNFTDFILYPDENISEEMVKSGSGKAVYSFQSPEIQFKNISLFALVAQKKFQCKQIKIDSPALQISGDEFLQTDSVQNVENMLRALRPLFQTHIKEISIESIHLTNAKYALYHTLNDSMQISKAEQISVEIKEFKTDSSMVFGNNTIFETADILVRLNNFHNDLGDSLHNVNIEKLEYSLKTEVIRATGFHLTAKQKAPGRNIYDIQVPQFYMKSKSMSRFALNDSVKIQYLEFDQPRIKFYQKENPEKLQIEDLTNFDLYKLIQNQFTKIEVDSFYLVDAKLEIYRQPDFTRFQQQFNSIEVTLKGFVLDSVSAQNQEKILYADDLEMLIRDYHLRLADNEHDFRAGSLFVSTFSDSLSARRIQVFPVDPLGISSRAVVKIDCDGLQIEHVNLKELYHTRILPTSKIEITNPNVQISYHTERKKSTKQRETGLLFDLVSAYLEGVYSNLVFIDNGVLNIENLYKNKRQGYFETKFDFSLTDFSLDSASIERTDKFFYASNFDLRFSNYEMKLVDNLHKLDVDSIYISSINQKVQIENLLLQPVVKEVTDELMQKYNRSELYNIFVPRIELTGINLRNAFFHNKLSISNFRISKPEIYFENFSALRASREKKEFTEFYQLIFNYMNDFDIKNITIPDGEISWVNHTKKGKTISFDNEFSATLENFRLNENELDKKRLLFSDNFDISVKDQFFMLSDSVHILRAGEINLSTKESSIHIKDALLYPVISSDNYNELPTTYQVSIPELKFSNFNFLKAFYSKELNLEKLDINNAKFQIYNKTGALKSLDLKKYNFPLPSFIQSLQLNELRINNGEVTTYEMEGMNQKARSSFKINLLMPRLSLENNEQNRAEISSGNMVLAVSDFKSSVGQSHNVAIDRIDFNRLRKTVSIHQLKVAPFIAGARENRFTIFAPHLEFTDFDINKALEENNFSFDQIKIQEPEIKIEINDSIRGDKFDFVQNLDLYPFAESFVDKIQVNNLDLNNADINFNWFEKELIDKKINFNFKDIVISENQPPSNLLNSKEFEISTTNLQKTDKNKHYEFTVDSLIYNSAKHNVLFKNIRVIPLISMPEMIREKGFQTDYLNAGIDFVELKKIDEKRWLKENILDAGVLQIGPANIEIFRNKRYPFDHSQRPSWPQDLIKKIGQPFVFDSIRMSPSFLKYSELLNISDEPGIIEFNKLQFSAGKISNIAKITSRYKHFRINASALLLNQAALNATINFDLTDDNYSHTVSGSLGNMPLPVLNQIIEKSAPVSVESGYLTRFDFDMSLDKTKATGELFFGYDDFKISILDYEKDEVRKSRLATFWANKMVLNSKNPKGDLFLPETIYYERDPQRSIINYWWKAIYSGAKKTLGLGTDEE